MRSCVNKITHLSPDACPVHVYSYSGAKADKVLDNLVQNLEGRYEPPRLVAVEFGANELKDKWHPYPKAPDTVTHPTILRYELEPALSRLADIVEVWDLQKVVTELIFQMQSKSSCGRLCWWESTNSSRRTIFAIVGTISTLHWSGYAAAATTSLKTGRRRRGGGMWSPILVGSSSTTECTPAIAPAITREATITAFLAVKAVMRPSSDVVYSSSMINCNL